MVSSYFNFFAVLQPVFMLSGVIQNKNNNLEFFAVQLSIYETEDEICFILLFFDAVINASVKQKSMPSFRWSSDSSVISKLGGRGISQCFNVGSIKKTKQKLTDGPCALKLEHWIYTQTSKYHHAARIFRQFSHCFMKTFTRTQSCWLSNAFRSLARRVFSS